MADYPEGLKEKYRDWWDKPWTVKARRFRNHGFHRNLNELGRLTPNFTFAEVACHDGTPLPRRYRWRMRKHCFKLEQFRHAVGDKSMPILSGYRTPAYNAEIGGASQSRHMSGDATDFSSQTVNRIGNVRFFQVAEAIFQNDGVGDYPSGSAHLDSRGYRARWRSF